MEVSLARFRPMVEDDVPAVLTLEHSAFSVPWTRQMLRDELAARGRTYLILDGETGIAAYGGFMIVGTDAHIMTMAVDEPHRRQGIGTSLLLALIDAALAAGAEHLTLELRVSNEAALGLYERFGFAPVGIWPSYYLDEDALVMWAVDAAGAEYRRVLDRIREGANG
jgi:ribosomal-protein-alanine N-acetyltransferase